MLSKFRCVIYRVYILQKLHLQVRKPLISTPRQHICHYFITGKITLTPSRQSGSTLMFTDNKGCITMITENIAIWVVARHSAAASAA